MEEFHEIPLEDNFYLIGDRQNTTYQNKIAYLLSEKALKLHALPHKNTNEKTIKIKFCGLSALTLLGGYKSGKDLEKNPATKAFLDLIENKDNIITKLNNENISIEIKLLFAYPYSDFFYDLVQAELYNVKGLSVECIKKGEEYIHSLDVPETINYNDVRELSITYRHLIHSLRTLQVHLNEDIFSFKKENIKNKITIKFTPLSILACMLQINNNVFIDPYLYAKEDRHSLFLSLSSPISKISAIPLAMVKNDQNDNIIQNHYYSVLSNFKYLWQHPLTLYSSDATYFKRMEGNYTLSKIIEPHLVYYTEKAKRITRILKDRQQYISPSKVDSWKQYCKIQFTRYTSKFQENMYQRLDSVKLFIVGSWSDNSPNEYMKAFEEFIEEKFSENQKGLNIEPIVVRASNGDELQKLIYQNLKSSHLGCVIQTADIELKNGDWVSRPNVYFEKGYLMKQLGRYRNYKNIEKERIFVWKSDQVKIESDNANYGYTNFSDLESFKFQFYKIIYWLWEFTELNSPNTLELLNENEEELIKFNEIISKNNTKSSLEVKKINEYLSEIKKIKKEINNYELTKNKS